MQLRRELYRLEEHRCEADLTLKELGERLGMPESTVTHAIRTGRCNQRTAYRIRKYLEGLGASESAA